MIKHPIKRGKKIFGKGEDKDKYWTCPHCGFRIDSTKVEKDDKWHVELEET